MPATVIPFGDATPRSEHTTTTRTAEESTEIPVVELGAPSIRYVVVNRYRARGTGWPIREMPISRPIEAWSPEDLDGFIRQALTWEDFSAAPDRMRLSGTPDKLLLVEIFAQGERSLKFRIDGWPETLLQALIPRAQEAMLFWRPKDPGVHEDDQLGGA